MQPIVTLLDVIFFFMCFDFDFYVIVPYMWDLFSKFILYKVGQVLESSFGTIYGVG